MSGQEQILRVRAALRDYENDYAKIDELQTSEELHLFAKNWNWDDGAPPLLKIIRNPLCDKATALGLFWNGDLVFLLENSSRAQVKEHETECYDFAVELMERFRSGFYTSEMFYFDPRADRLDLSKLNHVLPGEMLGPTRGERVDHLLIAL